MTAIRNAPSSLKRFWHPREKQLLLDFEGYLPDVDDPSKLYRNVDQELKEFGSISGAKALVLLGEPGMGKTTSVKEEFSRLKEQFLHSNTTVRWFDLKPFDTGDLLVRRVFESKEIVEWSQGSGVMHLFLDSLDECRLRIESLGSLLVEELRKLPVERLRIRLLCRTGVWSSFPEADLRSVFGQLEVYKLAPLRKSDVSHWVENSGVETENFLEEVDNKRISALAIKPVTLAFLVNLFKKDGSFPSTQSELYQKGIRVLCEDPDDKRRRNLTDDERFLIASRIAVVTVLSNKTAIWISRKSEGVLDSDITPSDLISFSERLGGREFIITEEMIREVLNTALFTSADQDRLVWSHLTYAEFLAAYYLVRCQIPKTKVLSLIRLSAGRDTKIVPQLSETVAWIASLDLVVLSEIIATDPEVLLHADIADSDDSLKAMLVTALLSAFEYLKIHDGYIGIRSAYKKLRCSSLYELLLPYLNEDREFVARRAAIEIGVATRTTGLVPALISLALRNSESPLIRAKAAEAVSALGSKGQKTELLPLLELGEEFDPDDEIRGAALEGLWPEILSADALFSVLSFERNQSFSGAYNDFLRSSVIPHLKDEDLAVALRWARRRCQNTNRDFSAVPWLIDGLLRIAWMQLEDPEICQLFAEIYHLRSEAYVSMLSSNSAGRFEDLLVESESKRRILLKQLVADYSKNPKFLYNVVHGKSPVVKGSDLNWLIQSLLEEVDHEKAIVWADITSRVFDRNSMSEVNLILGLAYKNEFLRSAVSWMIGPTILGTEAAAKQKQEFHMVQEWRNDRPKSRDESIKLRALMDGYFSELEIGNLDGWWKLARDITYDPDDHSWMRSSDIRSGGGWKLLRHEEVSLIQKYAKLYVERYHPDYSLWIEKRRYSYRDFFGYKALRYLYEIDQDYILSLSKDIFVKWLPAIIHYWNENSKDETIRRTILGIAAEKLPEAVADQFMSAIEAVTAKCEYCMEISTFDQCWNPRFASIVLEQLAVSSAPDLIKLQVLDVFLNKVGFEPKAFEMVKSYVLLPLTSGMRRKKIILLGSIVFSKHCDFEAWAWLWGRIQTRRTFGNLFVPRLAEEFEREPRRLLDRLKEKQIGALYDHIVERFPYSDRMPRKGLGFRRIGRRDRVEEFRGDLLRYLSNKGTSEACEAIQKSLLKFPKLRFLKWSLSEAEEMLRRNLWRPLNPMALLKFLTDVDARVVLDARQLLDLVLESIDRYEQALRGVTPTVFEVWDEVRRDVYRPSDENHLSDHIKNHLGRDLRDRRLVVNREVQIRPTLGVRKGERTDILVQAHSGEDLITVVIEVKGEWNKTTMTSLNDQLAGRYLDKHKNCAGLYVVGYFNCKSWDPKDSRKKKSLDLSDLRNRLRAQSEAVSSVVVKSRVLDARLG